MISIQARNVNEGLRRALQKLDQCGTLRDSRNGKVMAFNEPVATTYTHPWERVIGAPQHRNANPVFHLVESLWMLAGFNGVSHITKYVKRMKEFSDDGVALWGAYGYRWRNFFGYDQLDWIIDELKANPQSRRCVLAMWNAMHTYGDASDYYPDLYVATHGGKDVPCNTHIYFDRRDDKLNMTVCCRSNDIWWGCYGANAVHMSMLQEYMALAIGVGMGWYCQMSNDLHLYTDIVSNELARNTAKQLDFNPYSQNVEAAPTLYDSMDDHEQFRGDCAALFTIPSYNYHKYIKLRFFHDTVFPMLRAWELRKTDYGAAQAEASRIEAADWRWAMKFWLDHNYGGAKR
jgi:thymidylate synthase